MATRRKTKSARTAGGRRGGKASGRRRGPPKGSIDPESKSERVRELIGSGLTARQIAEKVGCTMNLVYVVTSNVRAAARRAAAGRGRGRPPKPVSAGDGLEGLLAGVKALQQERDELRQALERIRDVLDTAV